MSSVTSGTTDARTVEEAVRHQLATALGGRRGMLEAAVPTAVFTVLFLTTHRLGLSIVVSVACALVLLAVRLVQRSTPQFAFNALVGIGIGTFFAWRAAQGGGDANDQALAYFLPGILYNAGYTVVMMLSVVVGWPVVGFMVGSVAGDPTAWHRDRHVVKLCARLTWLLVLPCVLRVLVQGPIYLSGRGADADTAIALLGTTKLVMGWPLQVAAFAAMAWLLGRNRTPLEPSESAPHV
ncbi:MAG: DUF3159 domain-containing protein [Marmoricola sp.]